jgi:hypothetical protein
VSIAELISEAEQSGVEIIPIGPNTLRVQGWRDDEGRDLIPIVEDRWQEILDYLQQSQARTAADAVRVAEKIVRSARRKAPRRKRGAK